MIWKVRSWLNMLLVTSPNNNTVQCSLLRWFCLSMCVSVCVPLPLHAWSNQWLLYVEAWVFKVFVLFIDMCVFASVTVFDWQLWVIGVGPTLCGDHWTGVEISTKVINYTHIHVIQFYTLLNYTHNLHTRGKDKHIQVPGIWNVCMYVCNYCTCTVCVVCMVSCIKHIHTLSTLRYVNTECLMFQNLRLKDRPLTFFFL